jgi:SAM-dependent methyltransferase
MTLVVSNELCSDGPPISAMHHSSAAAVDRHFTRRGHGLEFEMEARWIAGSLPAGAKRVLDIGCGIGALFPVIGEARAVGIDYVFAGLRRTRDRFPASRLACGDGATLPFAGECVDAITAQHVIEHMPDPDAACREWRRVVRPQGRLIIVTPNAEFRDPSIFDDPSHTTIFSRQTLREILEKAGFTVDFVCTLGLPWFRNYHEVWGGWRLRRMVLGNAGTIAQLPGMRGSGQSLCCIARRSAT